MLSLLRMQSKPEVSYLGNPIMHENIGNLEVPMNNILRGQVLQSSINISDDIIDLPLL